jgi:alpha/beta superfamily hydrolase
VVEPKALSLESGDGIHLDAAFAPSVTSSSKAVLLAHGIGVDLDECGMFSKLAARLAASGYSSLRFSFRGHGASDGTDREMTIAGEVLDLRAGLDWVLERFDEVNLLGCSFGAVAACLSLPVYEPRLQKLILWNPVLDLPATFLKPTLPWGLQNFSPQAQAGALATGFLPIDGTFKLGRVALDEMAHHDIGEYLVAATIETLIVHGDDDHSVPYESSRQAAQSRPGIVLQTIRGSDHGFSGHANEVIAATLDWLRR